MRLAELWREARGMRRAHPSGWLVAWSRVMTVRSGRVQAYLRMSERDRRTAYPWLYDKQVRKRQDG